MNKPFFTAILLFGVLLTVAACNLIPSTGSATTPASGQAVIATAWTAELVGELDKVDSCIRVNDRDSDASYLLVWPPDIAVTTEKDSIRVVTGVTTGNRKEVVLRIGETIRLSGGETDSLDEQLKQTVPENCPGPYWVVGTEVGLFEP
jgi:hypothetical protein